MDSNLNWVLKNELISKRHFDKFIKGVSTQICNMLIKPKFYLTPKSFFSVTAFCIKVA